MRVAKYILSTFFIFIAQINILPQSQIKNHIGVGISVDPARIGRNNYTDYIINLYNSGAFALDSQAPILFYLPVNIKNFRIEPLFGFNSVHYENVSDSRWTTISNYSISTDTYKAEIFTIGAGGYYVVSLSKLFDIYFGPKFNADFVSLTNSYNNQDYANNNYTDNSSIVYSKEVDITVGADFGAEYFPVSEFSLGADIGLAYTSMGNPKVNETSSSVPPASYIPPNPINTNDRTQYLINTRGIFFVRWYFL